MLTSKLSVRLQIRSRALVSEAMKATPVRPHQLPRKSCAVLYVKTCTVLFMHTCVFGSGLEFITFPTLFKISRESLHPYFVCALHYDAYFLMILAAFSY